MTGVLVTNIRYSLFGFFLCACVFTHNTEGKSLKLVEVLKSTREQAPKVLASLEKVMAAKQKVVAARGAFDANAFFDYYQRESPVYPGDHFQGKIEKPFQTLGAKVYAGYRKSDGKFPDYEGERVTLSDGELKAGLSFNLLRNFSIDEKRLKLAQSRFKLLKAEFKNKEVFMKLQKEASLAFWNWAAAGNMLRVAKDLLSLAENRQVAFEKRIKRGDLAALYAVENRQYIVKRKSKVVKANAEFLMATFYLSLYWRDDRGNPLIATYESLPNLEEMEQAPFTNKNLKVDDLVKMNFTLNALNTELDAAKREQDFFDSRFLPELKVKYEVMRDDGSGSSTLRGTDHKVVVGMTIPLERNLLKGNELANKAKQRMIKHEMKLLSDSIGVKLNQLKTKLEASLEIIDYTKQEVDLGEQLEVGEKKKFRSGASDFFVVNLREQNTFDARLKRIEALFTYQETVAKYRELLMDYKL